MKRWLRHLPAGEPARPSVEALERRRREVRASRAAQARHRRAGFVLCGVVAALAHVGVVLPLFGLWTSSSGEAPPETVVKMVSLSRGARPALRAERPEPRARDRAEERDEDEELADRQVVTLPRSTDERPEHADYLARDDHKAERETKSRMAQMDFRNPAHRPSIGVDQEILEAARKAAEGEPQSASSGGGGQGAQGTGKEASTGEGSRALAFEVPKVARQEKLNLAAKERGDLAQRPSLVELPGKGQRLRLSLGKELSLDAALGSGGAGAPGVEGRRGRGFGDLPDLAALTPTLEELQRVTGAPAPDYLPEVESDAETRLNAWRWRHAAFFDRLKRGVAREWQGRKVYNRHDPTRAVYGTQELVTVLRVKIDRQGNIVELNVAEPSGADFLDDEAVRTMRATGPFPNPPEGLFGGKETFAFRFGFIITNESRSIDFNWKPY